MSKAWMPIYWGDYLRDTGRLTALEHGCYLLLIAHYWNTGGLPNDEQDIHRITRCPNNQWARVWKNIQSYFSVQRNKSGSLEWKHKRLDAELEKAEAISLKRRIYGAKGALASHGKINRERNYDAAFARQRGDQSQSPKILSYSDVAERARKRTSEEER